MSKLFKIIAGGGIVILLLCISLVSLGVLVGEQNEILTTLTPPTASPIPLVLSPTLKCDGKIQWQELFFEFAATLGKLDANDSKAEMTNIYNEMERIIDEQEHVYSPDCWDFCTDKVMQYEDFITSGTLYASQGNLILGTEYFDKAFALDIGSCE